MATKQERYQFRKERTKKKLEAAGIKHPRLSVYRSVNYLSARNLKANIKPPVKALKQPPLWANLSLKKHWKKASKKFALTEVPGFITAE